MRHRGHLFLGFGLGMACAAAFIYGVTLTSMTKTLDSRTQNTLSSNASIYGKGVTLAVQDALHVAELVAAGKMDAELLARSGLVLSAGVLKWNQEEFSYSKHVESAKLAQLGIDPKGINEGLELFHNEIVNAGAEEEQIYSGLLGEDVPMLLLIAPAARESDDKALSYVAILNARFLLEALRLNSEETIYLVDRSGTILLHPEHDRGIHRESASFNPIVKKFYSTPDPFGALKFKDDRTKAEYLGTFSRLPYAGSGVIAQIPTNVVFAPIKFLRNALILSVAIALLLALTGIYWSAPFYSAKKKSDEAEQVELRLVS